MNTKPNKVFLHPEKEEIMSRLLSGESVKEIESWLKKKHPKKRRLWISYATLQKFRKEHLHLEKDVIEDIKAAKKEQEQESNFLEKKALLLSSNAYQQKINEIATNKLDSDRKLVEIMTLLGTRIEYYFNMFQDPVIKTSIKDDKMFMELLNVQRTMIQDYKKYVERVADQRIEHNVNITVVNEQITVLKNIVFEVLQSLDPSLIPLFVDKVNSRLLDVNHGTTIYDNYLNEPHKLEVFDAE